MKSEQNAMIGLKIARCSLFQRVAFMKRTLGTSRCVNSHDTLPSKDKANSVAC